MTILIVDDQPNLIKVTAAALRLVDCRPLGASSVSEATQLLASEKIDAVLLDLNLNGESGFEFLSQIMSGPTPLPVIIFTAQSRDEVAAEAKSRGAFDCMVKPFSLEDLRNQIARIADHLNQASPHPKE